MSLSYFILKQFPVLPPSFYRAADVAYVASRVLELVYTADDMQPLADALRAAASPLAATVPRAPYRWDEARRALLRAELDAWYARAYGLTRDELRYILDPADVHGPDFPGETFRVLKEKETPNSANTAPVASCWRRGINCRRASHEIENWHETNTHAILVIAACCIFSVTHVLAGGGNEPRFGHRQREWNLLWVGHQPCRERKAREFIGGGFAHAGVAREFAIAGKRPGPVLHCPKRCHSRSVDGDGNFHQSH